MKKLIMFVMVLAIATSAMALKYVDDAPDFAGCPGSASVFWEFVDEGCMPTTDMGVDPYYYDPDPALTPVFGSRHWDDPTPGSGWGGSYGAAGWTWANGAFTILAEDSFNQSVPERSEQLYLRQYFQIVHTMVPGIQQTDYRWPIGLGLELWDMSADEYAPDGWTGCPVGYEGLDGDGYRDGYENVPPDIHYQIDPPNGIWYKSIWIHDFSVEGDVYTAATGQAFDALFEATHTACILGMDFDPEGGEIFMIEEATLDFIWFSMPDRSDIPPEICFRPGATEPPIEYDTFDLPIYEPMDLQVEDPCIIGPEPMGPTEGEVLVHLAWQPSYVDEGGNEVDYDTFTVTIVFDPDPNSAGSGNSEFVVTKVNDVPVTIGYGAPDLDPNQNVTLTFTEADFTVDQSVSLAAIGDTDIEGNETRTIEFTITTDVDDPNFGGPGSDPVVVPKRLVVVDNDIPQISANPYEFNLSENNSPDTTCFGVRLSHLPEDGATIYVYVALDGTDSIAIDPNFVQFPPYGEPNRLTFLATNLQPFNSATMTSSWHVEQTICVGVNDDDELVEEGLRYPEGEIIFTPFSEDIRYLVEWLNPDGSEVENDPCTDEVEISDGLGEETFLTVIAEDNECGARGYNRADIAGGGEEGDEPDCIVGLADIAKMYEQWMLCTYPYDAGEWGTTSKTWDECGPLWTLFEEEE